MLHGVFECDTACGGGDATAAGGRDSSGRGAVAALGPGIAAAVTVAHRAFPLTAFQEEGARRLRHILRTRGGAILADAVGLGKTYVALALVEEALRSGREVVVVVPAALRGSWKGPLRRLSTTRGGDPQGPVGVRLVSHAQLSRGASMPPGSRPRRVVVDEAHRFRNPATRRYRTLARVLHGRDAVGVPTELLLLTATPVNNSVVDLYHLVRLFLPDGGLRDAGIPSLRAAFLGESTGGRGGFAQGGMNAGPDALAVRAAVRELVVRRTRRMVRERFGTASPPGTNVRFPGRAPVSVVPYVDPGVPDRVRRIEGLELRAYGPGATALVRFGLLKRMASSGWAFRRSLMRLRTFLEEVAEAGERGQLLPPGGRFRGGDGDPLQRLLPGVLTERAPPDVDPERLAASARRDIELAEALIGEEPINDGKAAALEALLDRLEGEKVVLFTEYRDTAEHLWRGLGRRFRVGRVDGASAWLGRRPAGRGAVVHRFAPVSNKRSPPIERERVDILIATDVLSEGLNLQDARHVVSYDLPWNPVRLLQRIGRIDRLGSPHDVVFAHVFVPDRGLDEVLGLTRRLRRKLDGISGSVGLDAADDLLEGLARGRPALVDGALTATEDGDVSEPWEALRTLWLRHAGGRPSRQRCPYTGAPPWTEELRLPCSSAGCDIAAVALVTLGPRVQLVELDREGAASPAGPGAKTVLELALAGVGARDPSGNPGDDVDLNARRNQALRDLKQYLDRQVAAARAPARLRPGDAGSRLARRVRQALARAGSRTGPALVRTAETVLELLAQPLPPALEAEVDGFLVRARAADYDAQLLVSGAAELLQGPDGLGPDSLRRLSRNTAPAVGRGLPSGRSGPRPHIPALLLVTPAQETPGSNRNPVPPDGAVSGGRAPSEPAG
jgi:superfamily II DNA or RNA helicase